MKLRVKKIILGWLLCGCLGLLAPGCLAPPDPLAKPTITFTLDARTRELLEQLEVQRTAANGAVFGRNFIGLVVPERFLAYEPFVLGLATESPIPTILYLDAPWVHRYAAANWLYELDRTGVFEAQKLVPAVARAFSVRRSGPAGKTAALMGVPNAIKGNILFYRQDLLDKYRQKPPRHWDELKAVCREIMSRERSLKYGLIFHVTNFVNDFYPIFWGFGGEVQDAEGNLTLLQPQMLARAEAALQEIVGMQGTLAPGPGLLKQFEGPGTLRQAFLRGEALFMINWNTRLQDLREMLASPEWQGKAAFASTLQVGVAPIPSQTGQPRRFSNIGSFGWSINRFAVTDFRVMENAKTFLNLVNSDRFQVLRAETAGEVPALQSALAKVKNPEVLRVYETIFAAPEVFLEPRPKSRRLNNILEKNLLDALYGRATPAAAIQAAAAQLRQITNWD